MAIVALVSTSNTRTKLSSDAEAAITPEGWAATETTPRQWPVLVRTSSSSSGLHSLTVSSRDPVNRRDGRVSVAGTQVAAQTDSSWAFSTDFRPASFIDFAISVIRTLKLVPVDLGVFTLKFCFLNHVLEFVHGFLKFIDVGPDI